MVTTHNKPETHGNNRMTRSAVEYVQDDCLRKMPEVDRNDSVYTKKFSSIVDKINQRVNSRSK